MSKEEEGKIKIDTISRGMRGIAGELCIEMEKQGITSIEFNFGGGRGMIMNVSITQAMLRGARSST